MQTAFASNAYSSNTNANTAPHITRPHRSPLCAMITRDPDDIFRAQKLRYRVFSEDMGAELQSGSQGIDKDQFDDHCYHLIVKDDDTDEIVGYSRIITDDVAHALGGFYTQTEFDIHQILVPGKSYMEIGRTCVASDFRSGAVIALLWARLGQFMVEHQTDYLMGCASISLSDGGSTAQAVINYLRDKHFTPETQRVIPKACLPNIETKQEGKSLIPPLLKAYLRIGCRACGEAFWDQEFNVADVVVLLDRREINQRYLKHFLRAA